MEVIIIWVCLPLNVPMSLGLPFGGPWTSTSLEMYLCWALILVSVSGYRAQMQGVKSSPAGSS